MRFQLGILGWLCVAMAGCAASESAHRIELGAPIQSQGIGHAERLVDGKRAFEGSEWNSTAATVIRSPDGFALFDLGEVTHIDAAYIQGDNNDQFILEVSTDGASFTELWVAGSVGEPGLRGRWVRSLDRSARFVRLTAIGSPRAGVGST